MLALLEPSLQELIVPRYDQSVFLVYWEFAKAVIQEEGTPQTILIEAASYPISIHPGWASWVPDLRWRRRRERLSVPIWEQHDSLRLSDSRRLTRKHAIQFTPEFGMIVSGVQVARIIRDVPWGILLAAEDIDLAEDFKAYLELHPPVRVTITSIQNIN